MQKDVTVGFKGTLLEINPQEGDFIRYKSDNLERDYIVGGDLYSKLCSSYLDPNHPNSKCALFTLRRRISYTNYSKWETTSKNMIINTANFDGVEIKELDKDTVAYRFRFKKSEQKFQTLIFNSVVYEVVTNNGVPDWTTVKEV